MAHALKQIGVGLIGYGLGGRVFHAPFIQATDGLALRAVVSRDPAKVLGKLPGVAVFPSVDELLAQDGIDLVVVSSPDALHAEHAIAALRAGKHVVVDKPFATTLADARLITETADRAGKMVTVFHNRRWDADFLTLQRLIAEGRLGRIVHFESHFDRWRPEAAAVWKEAREGGSWLDLGPHLVDQALCLFGKPEAVTADIATMREGAPAPDWFHAVLHYPGMRAVLHSSKLAADHRLRFAVHGTGGSWIKHGLDTQEGAIVAGALPGDANLGCDPVLGMFSQAGYRELPVANERGNYGLFWQGLARALQWDEPNPVPVNEALSVMEVLQAGLESTAKGCTVRL
ncbi:MAG TPA: oxidoreductase [Afipia sp.]